MTNRDQRYFRFGPYCIDTQDHILLRNREIVPLGETSGRILSALVQGKGEISSKEALRQIGWQENNIHVEEENIYKSIQALRKIFGSDRGYIHNVRGKGYRFIANVEEVNEESWKRMIEVPHSSFENQFLPRENPGTGFITRAGDIIGPLFSNIGDILVPRLNAKIAVLMLLALMINLLLPMTATERQGTTRGPVITGEGTVIAGAMILTPIKGVTGEEDQMMGSRITEKLETEINTDLSPLVPQINSKTGTPEIGDRRIDPVKRGNASRPAAIFSGTAEKRKDTLLVRANLKRLHDNFIVWEVAIEESLRDMEAAIASISRRISREVVEALARVNTYVSSAKAFLSHPNSTDYVNGDRNLAKRTPSSIRASIEAFGRAINKDPRNALAYANLADAYILIGGVGYNEMPPIDAFPKAKEAASKALDLDKNLPEARSATAMVKLFYDYDFAEADREFRRAIFLSLNRGHEDPVARHWYANYLALVGRFDESLVQIKRARELAPSSPIINATIGWTHYFARDYDQAIISCRKALESHEDFYVTHAFLGFAYAQKLMYKDAIRELTRAKELSQNSPVMIAELGRVHALAGNEKEAYKALSELQALSTQRYVSPYSIAMVYVGLGDKDAALGWLEKAFEEHSGWLVHMKVEPALDSLRTNERFGKLLKRVGLSN